MRKILVCISILFPATAFSQNIATSITKELTELSNKNSIVGFSVAIVNQDSIVYAKGFGYANQERKKLYTKNTVQPIASISKTLAGIALMKAQVMGVLDLDDDINEYLPFKITNPYFPNSKITIRNLATHTSGLRDSRNYSKTMIVDDFLKLPKKTKQFLSNNWCRKCEDNSDMSMIKFIENMYSSEGDWYKKKHFLKSATGTTYKYTNNNTSIAAYIIEHATGQPYTNFIKKHVTIPLKMTNSNWVSEGSITNDVATLYAANIVMPEMHDVTYPDGSFVTNVVDFGNYLSTVINGYAGESNIINSESYNEMITQQIDIAFEAGIFWEVDATSIGHSGEHAGTSTYAYFDKESLVGFILFGNTTVTKNLPEEEMEIIKVLRKYSGK